MVESFRRQGFACLRGGERTEKGGFRKRAAALQRTGSPKPAAPCAFLYAAETCKTILLVPIDHVLLFREVHDGANSVQIDTIYRSMALARYR
jgi:hypothetical protein